MSSTSVDGWLVRSGSDPVVFPDPRKRQHEPYARIVSPAAVSLPVRARRIALDFLHGSLLALSFVLVWVGVLYGWQFWQERVRIGPGVLVLVSFSITCALLFSIAGNVRIIDGPQHAPRGLVRGRRRPRLQDEGLAGNSSASPSPDASSVLRVVEAGR